MSKSQRIRAIFENNVSKMQSPEQKEYEAWKLKQHKEKTKSGETAAGIRRGQHVTPGNKADQVYGGRDHMGYLRVSPAQLKGQRLRMSLQHHVDRTKGSNPELAAKYRNLGAKRGLQLASTDHYRAGIKTLFESILNEILKNPRRRGDLSAKPKELTRTPVPYPELVSTSRQLRGDLKTAKEGGLRALAGLAGEKPDPKALAKEDEQSVKSSVRMAHARLSGSHKLGQTDAATRRLLRLPPAQRPTTAQSRALVAQQDREDSSVNYYREGLKALFENNYLRLHPVGKPGDQAIHDTLRAHFDSLDPKIGADLHKQLDHHIKMYHYVRETPGESGAHAELRRFEHEHLRNMAKTGSQGVTPNDVRQHFHMFNTDDPSDRLAHTAIKDSFYRPKESKNNIKAGLRALFEAILDEATGLGSQASKERQGKLERRFDALDNVARKQRGTTVSKGGVTYIGNRPVKTRGEEKVSKERARVALKLEPKVDDRDPNPDPS